MKHLIAHGYNLIVKRNEALVIWKATRRLIGGDSNCTRLTTSTCYRVPVVTGSLRSVLYFPSSESDLCVSCQKSFPSWMEYIHYEEAIREIVELGSRQILDSAEPDLYWPAL